MMWVKVRFCSIIPEKVFTLSELNAFCATNYLELVWYTFCRITREHTSDQNLMGVLKHMWVTFFLHREF